MKNGRYILLYAILVVVQILVVRYFGLSKYVLISVLPVLILLLPREVGVIWAMLIAFATGFVVDFFSNGMLGITPLALVPVALTRRPFAEMVFGDDQTAQEKELTIARFGIPKFSLAILLTCVVYFFVFIWADSAGTVAFWSAALRFVLSVVVSSLVCVFVAGLLRPS
jgi:hypothetical protein